MTSMSDFWVSASCREQFVSAIWEIPGFHLSYVRPDMMHISCLGILQYLSGNCLWEMFRSLGGSFRSPLSACSALENMMGVCARRLGQATPFSHLTVTMFRSTASDKPKFKAKAAENRHFLPILHQMLKHCFEADSEHARLRLQCVDALRRCYLEMESWSPSGSPHRLAKIGRQQLMLYSELRATSSDPALWHMYPKHHLFMNVLEADVTNPRLEWNYSDEADIGIAAKQAATCNVSHIPVQVIRRYCDTFDP